MRIAQNSFVGGELDPDLMGRQDLAAYFKSAAKLDNYIVLRSGAACKRGGTDHVCEVPEGVEAGGAKLIGFPYDETRGDLLLLAGGHLHVLGAGGAWAHDLEVPYAAEDVRDVRVTQSGDTLFFCHPDYAPMRLVRTPPEPWSEDPADWEFVFRAFDFFPNIPVPVISSVTGTGFSGTATKSLLYRVAAVTADGESLASTGLSISVPGVWTAGAFVTVAWSEVPGATAYRVYKKVRSAYGMILNVGQEAFKLSTAGATLTVSNYSGTWGAPAVLIDGVTAIIDSATNFCRFFSATMGATDYPWAKIDFGSAKRVCGVRIYEGGQYRWSGSWQYYPSNIGVFNLQYSTDNTNWTTLGTFRGSNSISAAGTLCSNADVSAEARYWRIIGTSNPGVTPWTLREIEWMGVGLATSAVDDYVEPDLTQSPIVQESPFKADDGYPATMSLYQQRSVFGGVPAKPHTLWFSRLADLYNYSTSEVLNDADAIRVTMAVTRPSEIMHLLPTRQALLIFTASGEWLCSAGSNADTVTPSAIRFDLQSGVGCGSLPPLAIGQNVVFAGRGDGSVRESGYQLERDAYVAMDRSVLSSHLFEGRRMVAWAYQQQPDSVVWVVMSDGALLSWTYLPEHEVWAWARHSTGAGGRWLDVAATGALIGAAGDTDEVYLLADRGALGVCVERMRARADADELDAADALCMDAVRALGEGGAAPEGFTAAHGVAGVPVAARLETLRPEPQDASLHGLRKRVTSVLLRLRRCGLAAGAEIGAAGGAAVPVRRAEAEDAGGGRVRLRTLDVETALKGSVNKDGNVVFADAGYWPCTVLSVVYDVTAE